MEVTYSIAGVEISGAEMERISVVSPLIIEICNAVRKRVMGC